MPSNDVEVVVVGGGAAGLAAAQRLRQASIACVLVEARTRLGGRAWSVVDRSGYALDVGCGWLHSADRNPWVAIAQAQGRTIDRTRPPWGRPSPSPAFPIAEQRAFFDASNAFEGEVLEPRDIPINSRELPIQFVPEIRMGDVETMLEQQLVPTLGG